MARDKFSIVLARIWKDPEFLALSTDGRALFMWSFTNPMANIAGLYQATIEDLAEALEQGANDSRVDTALAELAAKPLLAYDFDHSLVWVVSRAKHSARNTSMHRLIRADWEAAPPSRLKDLFAERYGDAFGLPTGGHHGNAQDS